MTHNAIGEGMLRWQTAGESHGEALVAMIEGLSLIHISEPTRPY